MSDPLAGKDRVFVFLQGPHGPFFFGLGHILRQTGAQIWRIGFNNGDAHFWPDKASYRPFLQPFDQWQEFFTSFIKNKKVTDIVLYGDTRYIHESAIKIARLAGITVHVFEEGYLRPYWVTYERNGSNGNSRLMDISVPEMQAHIAALDTDLPDAPALWGDMRHHMFYGALYHWFVWSGAAKYKNYRPHRAQTIRQEFWLYCKRFAFMVPYAIERSIATYRIKHGGFPYHLVLLQLEHDSSFQIHSPFGKMSEFLTLVLDSFAKHAPRHHHLVFKAHPLEDGRANMDEVITKIAAKYHISHRIHFVRGGKMAHLLNHARSAITVNSTAGQQVLWRGLPLKIFGSAVYGKDEFVSNQILGDFFAQPTSPDSHAYRDYRHYLLKTCQIPGGFYSRHGRRTLFKHIAAMMLCPDDPYDKFAQETASSLQQFQNIIKSD